MVAGAKYRGEFEERLKSVPRRSSSRTGQVITFIDELRTRSSAQVRLAIPRWTLQQHACRCSRAASCAWWAQRRSTSTASTSRRTRRLSVASRWCLSASRSVEDTIGILRGPEKRYEAHHKVAIADAALVAAAALSDRYITSRFLPDKAIDLIDESAPRLRMEIDLPGGDRHSAAFRRSTQDGRDGGRSRNGRGVEGAVEKIRADLADKEEELLGLRAKWDQEKSGLDKVGDLKGPHRRTAKHG